MNLPYVKTTMFFTDGTVGWTESHFYNSIVALTSPVLYAAAKALCLARVKCLDGKFAKLTDCRLSIDNVNRDSVHLKTTDIPVPTASGYSGGPNPSSTNWTYQTPQVSWPILFDTSIVTTDSIVYIAGMPASTTQTGPGPFDDPSPPVAGTYLQGYADFLVAGPWGAQARTWPVGAQTALNSIPLSAPTMWGAATASVPNTLTFTVGAWPGGIPPVQGQYIRLGGSKWTSILKRQRYNASYPVLNASATTVTVATPRITIAPAWTIPGYIQVNIWTVASYVASSLRNLTHHKRGRPTYSPRGRQSAR